MLRKGNVFGVLYLDSHIVLTNKSKSCAWHLASPEGTVQNISSKINPKIIWLGLQLPPPRPFPQTIKEMPLRQISTSAFHYSALKQCMCVCVCGGGGGGELQHNKYPKISDVSCQVNNMIRFPQHFFYPKTFSALSLSFPHPFLLLFFYVFPCPSCARGSKSDRELIFRTHVQ